MMTLNYQESLRLLQGSILTIGFRLSLLAWFTPSLPSDGCTAADALRRLLT